MPMLAAIWTVAVHGEVTLEKYHAVKETQGFKQYLDGVGTGFFGQIHTKIRVIWHACIASQENFRFTPRIMCKFWKTTYTAWLTNQIPSRTAYLLNYFS